jgi:hypothetical protein
MCRALPLPLCVAQRHHCQSIIERVRSRSLALQLNAIGEDVPSLLCSRRHRIPERNSPPTRRSKHSSRREWLQRKLFRYGSSVLRIMRLRKKFVSVR